MYSHIINLALIVTNTAVLVGCATCDVAAPGISPAEMQVLVSDYYWKRDLPAPTYSAAQLDALLRASADPTLDGARSEAQMTRLVVAIASVGDQKFAEALSRQPKRVKHMVGFFISGLWTRHDLHYPRTQAVLAASRK